LKMAKKPKVVGGKKQCKKKKTSRGRGTVGRPVRRHRGS